MRFMKNLKNIMMWMGNSTHIGDVCGIIGRMDANALKGRSDLGTLSRCEMNFIGNFADMSNM